MTISDVHPDGYSQFLRQNILRARYREGDEKPVPMEPGKVYRFAIDIYPISNVTNQIFHDREHASRVNLPIVPRETITQ